AGQDPTGTTVTGTASFVVGQLSGNAWTTVQSMNKSGYAALIDKASVTTGVFKLTFTKDPATVARLAGGDQATHALLTQDPQDVIATALASLHGGTIPDTVQPAKAVSPTPSWLVPALIGGGVLLLGAFFFMSKKKAKANRGRHRRNSRVRKYAKV